MARQALAGAERAARASHHLEMRWLRRSGGISSYELRFLLVCFCELACCKTLALTARLLQTLLRAWNGLQDGL